MTPVTIVGRSSSHYTRVTRIFALELEIAHGFQPVLDIMSTDVGVYADNPALKVPILVDEDGPLFGTENICRALVRRAARESDVVLRGDVAHRLVANAEEMTLGIMSTEVAIIMARTTGGAPGPKALRSIENSLTFLDQNVDALLAALPAHRALSFVETAIFCVLRHLPFREVMDVAPWKRLNAFGERFAERESARATTFHFDTP